MSYMCCAIEGERERDYRVPCAVDSIWIILNKCFFPVTLLCYSQFTSVIHFTSCLVFLFHMLTSIGCRARVAQIILSLLIRLELLVGNIEDTLYQKALTWWRLRLLTPSLISITTTKKTILLFLLNVGINLIGLQLVWTKAGDNGM